MAAQKKQSSLLDHLNRDAYIYLSVLSTRFGADIERICAEHQLTEAHYRVLWVLCLSETTKPIPMGDIVDGVINKASDVTRLVDKLERLKLVARSSSPVDKRRVLVKATASGRKVFTQITTAIKAVHYDQWRGLSQSELSTLVSLLNKAMVGSYE